MSDDDYDTEAVKLWIVILLACLVVIFSAMKVSAHDQWGDGVDVPDWVKTTCCGKADAHHLRPEQVHYRPNNTIEFDGYKGQISQNVVMPSPDGTAWVFWKVYPDGSNSVIYCAFLPPNSF